MGYALAEDSYGERGRESFSHESEVEVTLSFSDWFIKLVSGHFIDRPRLSGNFLYSYSFSGIL